MNSERMQASHMQQAQCLETLFVSHTDATLKYYTVRSFIVCCKGGLIETQLVLRFSDVVRQPSIVSPYQLSW